MDAKELREDLQNYALEDRLSEMVQTMRAHIAFWKGLYTEADFIQWSAQLHQLERERKLGIIPNEQYQLSRNTLRHTLIEVAMQAGKSPPPAPNAGDRLLDQAIQAFRDQQFDQAERYLLEAFAQGFSQKEKAYAHSVLGNIYGEQHRWQEAIAEHTKALELDSGKARVWTNLGVGYRNVGEYDKAAACYERALSLDPDYAEVHISLGALHLKHTQNFSEAIRHLQFALERNPNHAIAHANMAIAKASIGDFEAAEDYLQRAVINGYRNAASCRSIIDNLKATL